MGIIKYFECLAKGAYAIDNMVPSFDFLPGEVDLYKSLKEKKEDIKRKYGIEINASDEEAIKKDWETVGKDLGKIIGSDNKCKIFK